MTQDEARKLWDYDPGTGVFTWRVKTANGIPAGSVAGTTSRKSESGYRCRQIGIGGKYYYAHRLAWLYMTGEWPQHEIDHINLDPLDNRWCNLREATHSQNHANCKTRKRKCSASALKGVFQKAGSKRFFSAIRFQKKVYYLGTFDTEEEAHAAYCKAAHEIHGEFAKI